MEYTECSYTTCGNPVFARGICRKHYEQERLETASPCSVSGCQEKAYRGDLCAAHYREKQKASKPLCTVPGCGAPQKTLKSGLCEKHLFRYSRHGTIEQPRSTDWGSREAHALYDTWNYHKRRGDKGLCTAWRADFWVFVAAVEPKPDGHTLRRQDTTLPLGPDNWYWKQSIQSEDKAAYARTWRANNPRKAKSHDIKKMYGITLEQYESMSEAQNHRCDICGNVEQSVDRAGIPRRLAVDHCHTTGTIRKLLCSACNKALGGFRDDPELLRKAAAYIERNR